MISIKLKNYPVFSSANCPVRTLGLTVKCPLNATWTALHEDTLLSISKISEADNGNLKKNKVTGSHQHCLNYC